MDFCILTKLQQPGELYSNPNPKNIIIRETDKPVEIVLNGSEDTVTIPNPGMYSFVAQVIPKSQSTDSKLKTLFQRKTVVKTGGICLINPGEYHVSVSRHDQYRITPKIINVHYVRVQ